MKRLDYFFEKNMIFVLDPKIIYLQLLFMSYIEKMILLKSYNLEGKIRKDYNKPWIKYSHVFIRRAVLKTPSDLYSCVDLMRSLFITLRVKNLKRITELRWEDCPFSIDRGYRRMCISRLVLWELQSYVDTSVLRVPSPTNFIATYSWTINMHPRLRLQITLEHLRVQGETIRCRYNLTVISNSTMKQLFSFCGFFSNYTIHPKHHYVIYTLYYGPDYYFAMESLFDTISENSFVSARIQTTVQKQISNNIHEILIPVIKVLVGLYHIITRKYEQLVIYYNINNTRSLLYNGPGYLSENIHLRQGNHSIYCDTYQCILQMIYDYSENGKLSYKGVIFVTNWKQVTLCDRKQNITLKLDDTNSLKSKVEIFVLQSPNDTHINASIFHFSCNFSSVFPMKVDDSNCTYGGVSFSTIEGEHFREVRLLCSTKINDLLNLQNVYSDQNKLIFVKFAYKEYSSLNLTLKVSFTSCKFVAINVCLHREHNKFLDMTGIECMIAQVNNIPPCILYIDEENPNKTVDDRSAFDVNIFIEKSLDYYRNYEYHARGYLVNAAYVFTGERHIRTGEASLNDFKVGGEYSRHAVKTDFTITTWKHGIGYIWNYEEKTWMYTLKEYPWYWVKNIPKSRSVKQIMEVNSRFIPRSFDESDFFDALAPEDDISLDVKFYSKMPSHDKSLAFSCSFFGTRSWIDLHIKPEVLIKIESDPPSLWLEANQLNEIRRIFAKQVLILKVDKNHPILNSMKVDITITTKVKMCLNLLVRHFKVC